MDLLLKNTPAPLRKASFLLPLLGGSIFAAVFHFAYSGIDDNLYAVRDDGIITMSHARNLVEYGFIGINPSGGRVEGYSAPVQFFLFAAAYAAWGGLDYADYAAAQTACATFLLGALFILFFPERKLAAVVLTALAALFLACQRPFLEWHGSGMENAVTHVLFLAAVLILVSLARMERIVYPLAVPVFLAAISRIESIYHLGPLLVIFSLFWLRTFHNRRGLHFSCVVLGLWALFQLWRYLYFGDLQPNTAHGQSISIFDNLAPLLSLEGKRLHFAAFSAGKILAFHGGAVLLPALAGAFALVRCRRTVLLLLLLGSLTLTSAFSESVFGAARLDPARLTTHLAVFAALAAAVPLYCLSNGKHAPWTAPAMGTAAAAVLSMNVIDPYYLCCLPDFRKLTHGEFTRIAEAERLPRPTVAYPDIGVLSWSKQFNIVDLGELGSPIMAKTYGPFRSEYFFHYAAPDIIQNHGSWTCLYADEIFSDPRFRKLYRLEKQTPDAYPCTANPAAQPGFWIRSAIRSSSKSAERQLIDRLAANPSVGLLRDELESCQAQQEKTYDCAYVARSAWRFLPEFRQRGLIDELDAMFAAGRGAAFARYLIHGHRDGQAYMGVVDLMFDEMEILRAIRGSRPIIHSD